MVATGSPVGLAPGVELSTVDADVPAALDNLRELDGPPALSDRLARRGSEAIARVEDLHVTFRRDGKDLEAVRGVSLDVRRGEILGIVGESGSGKTVLGLSLLGLLRSVPPPRVAGTVEVLGVDMLRAPERERRALRRSSLGAIFQDPMTSLDPTMRIGRQLDLVTDASAESVKLLESVGIPEAHSRMRSFPHELSGGQRQRVMIAMAIAGNPALILADEPTTALDVTVQAQVLALVKRLRDELHSTFVFVTHDLGVAAQVADRVAVMYGGRIVEFGSVDQVLNAARHPYTIGLLASRLSLESDRTRPLSTLAGAPPDPRRIPPGCAFSPRCPIADEPCEVRSPELTVTDTGSRAACVHLDRSPELNAQRVRSESWPERSASPEPPRLMLRGVEKTFVIRSGSRQNSKVHALRGVDLEVQPGECMAVVGESGCGKSTLLRVIAGLTEVDSGEIRTSGGSAPQMVFQDVGASLTPWLRVGELLEERLHNLGRTGDDFKMPVATVLRLVGLNEEVARAKPGQLSGGQRQRVAVARAIIVPPSVLLCDEPTSALDVSLAATVLNLLGRLRRELELAMLFVTHDLAAARLVADRVAVMYLGRVVEVGPVDEIVQRPAHPYTKALLAAVPELAGRGGMTLQGDPASPSAVPIGCAFHPRCPEAVAECQAVDPELRELGPDDARLVACVLAR